MNVLESRDRAAISHCWSCLGYDNFVVDMLCFRSMQAVSLLLFFTNTRINSYSFWRSSSSLASMSTRLARFFLAYLDHDKAPCDGLSAFL